VFGGVMRLSPEKNPTGLLDAFSRICVEAPQAWLVLAGDGPQRGEIERRLQGQRLAERVRLLGARNDPERIYPLFDCFVLPSLSEGLPLALLEAMACARPVIASAVGQVGSVLGGLEATLVPPGDVGALAGALRAALAVRSPAPALRRRVEARYSVARMAHEYADVYRGLGGWHGHHAA